MENGGNGTMKSFGGVTVKRLEVGWCVGGVIKGIKESLQKYLEMGWVERVTQIGTKGTRIGNKGVQIGNKGTPNHRQTSTLTKITQNINFNRNFAVDENDIPSFLTICKPKISEYCNTANKLFCLDVLFKLTRKRKAKISREKICT